MLAVREAALEIHIEGRGAFVDEPRAIRLLRAHEEPNAPAITRVRRTQALGFAQCNEREPGRVSVGVQTRHLRPAAGLILRIEECLSSIANRGRVGVGPMQTE